MKNVQISNCIALEELKQLITDKKQKIIIIDARSREEFNELHIPEAVNFTILQLEAAGNLFNKTDIIITACGKGGGRSAQAAEMLLKLGFENSKWLSGGTFGWFEGIK